MNGGGGPSFCPILAAVVAFLGSRAATAAADLPGDDSLPRVQTRSTVRSNSTVGGPTLASSASFLSQASLGLRLEEEDDPGVLPRVQKINDLSSLQEHVRSVDETFAGIGSSVSEPVGLRIYEDSDSDSGRSTPMDVEQPDEALDHPPSGVASPSLNGDGWAPMTPTSPVEAVATVASLLDRPNSVFDFTKGFGDQLLKQVADKLRKFEDTEPVTTDSAVAADAQGHRPTKMQRTKRQFDLASLAGGRDPLATERVVTAIADIGLPTDTEWQAGDQRTPPQEVASGELQSLHPAGSLRLAALRAVATADCVAARATPMVEYLSAHAFSAVVLLAFAGGALHIRRRSRRLRAWDVARDACDTSPAALEMGLGLDRMDNL